MREPHNQLVAKREANGDKRVWVTGDNGVTCVKWSSTIGDRNDLVIHGEYVYGDHYYGHMNKATKEAEIAKAVEDALALKASEEKGEKPKPATKRATKATKAE